MGEIDPRSEVRELDRQNIKWELTLKMLLERQMNTVSAAFVQMCSMYR